MDYSLDGLFARWIIRSMDHLGDCLFSGLFARCIIRSMDHSLDGLFARWIIHSMNRDRLVSGLFTGKKDASSHFHFLLRLFLLLTCFFVAACSVRMADMPLPFMLMYWWQQWHQNLSCWQSTERDSFTLPLARHVA